MKATYFWAVYGELDEVCFPHFESREHKHFEQTLGVKFAAGTVLLSDGYGAYDAYAKKTGIAMLGALATEHLRGEGEL